MNAHLPITITYTTEAELQELEKLRMRVALLQQEICLEQVWIVHFKHQLKSDITKYLIVQINLTVYMFCCSSIQ